MSQLCGSRRRFTFTLPVLAALFIGTVNAAVTTTPIKVGDSYFVVGPMECVIYTRKFVPKLPYGLFTYKDKVKIINSYSAKAGSAAIINLGKDGHVAVVVAVDNSGSSRSIKIAEINVPIGSKVPRYRTATCGSKLSDCEKQLAITGYFRP